MDLYDWSWRGGLPEARDQRVPRSNVSRGNGWSRPLSSFQALAWTLLFIVALANFRIFIPFLPPNWNFIAYGVTGGLFVFHLVVHLMAASINPAEATVRLKNYAEPVPHFDRSKPASVIQNLCQVTDTKKAKHCGLCNNGSMRGLTAQVTALLRLPEVTVPACAGDGVTSAWGLRGRLAAGRHALACRACGPELQVVNFLTGARLSAHRFRGADQQPPTVLAMKEFSWQQRAGLLIGLEETEGSVLCLYDLALSRVVKAVALPGRVTAVEPVVNHGGPSVGTQHLHPSLRWFFGVVAVVTDVGHVLLVDLCLDAWSCGQNEVEASDLQVVTGTPAEVARVREKAVPAGRHLCFQLASPSGTAVSALRYIRRTNQLAVGFSDGCLALWNLKSMKRECHTQLAGGRVPVCALTFQEPENDPRHRCYLWAVQSTQDSEGDVLSLRLLQLAFGDRKCLASGRILYEGLENCEERYTLNLSGGMCPLRGQTSNPKLLGCQSIETFRYHDDREEALSPDTSVSVFTWQVNVYGQGRPSAYLGLFDINRWYHAHMPDSLRPGEYLHNCPYFALWSLESVARKTSPQHILDVLVHERSLSRGLPRWFPPPGQLFSPSSYSFDATCLLNSGIVRITCNGFHKETLTFLKKPGPRLRESIPDGCNRGLRAGLPSPRLVDSHPPNITQEEQLEAILSAAIHTSSLGLLTGCIKKWIAEEQPNLAANLRFVLEWTWNKVIFTKEEFDRLCAPLFDGSCRLIDPQTVQSLRQCCLLLSNLNSVPNCFPREAQDLPERGVRFVCGLTDLHRKCLVTRLICRYTQVVLWFLRSGLLPAGSDDAMPPPRLCYNYPVIQNYYTSRRQKCEHLSRGKWNPDHLMIDGMVSQLGGGVEKLWKRGEGGTGKYPPSSLHALLDIYLLNGVTEASKHAVTIYLLLDIMYSFPNKTDTCINSFRTAFAISWGQVKLIRGFWLIDHNDYESGLDLLCHPSTAKPVSWQHSRIIQAFMSQGELRHALRYIQTLKPTVSSVEDVLLHLTVLLSNRYVVEAWTFLRQNSPGRNVEELLWHVYEVCQETGLMEDLLQLPFTDTEQECLVRCLQSSPSVRSREFLLVHYLQRANYASALRLNETLNAHLMNERDPLLRERSAIRNAIVEQYGKSLPKLQQTLVFEQAKPYQPSTVLQEVSRPKPLSTVIKQTGTGIVLTRSTFISSVLSKIGEVWANSDPKDGTPACSSPKTEGPSPPRSHAKMPEAFVGTPVLEASQKVSRPLDRAVHPVARPSQRLGFTQQTPPRSPLCRASSALPTRSREKGWGPSSPRASEFRILRTPFVVNKAKTLAMSATSSGFADFTPPSILRSGLRTSPLPPPSLSPGKFLPTPLRLKETRISFMQEGVATKQTAEGADDSRTKVSLAPPFHKCGAPAESRWLRSKTAASSPDSPEKDHQETDLRSEDTASQSLEKLDVSKERSGTSTRSDQTTLEYQEAPSPGDSEELFVASKPASSSTELMTNFTEPTENHSDKDGLESEVTPPDLEKQMGPLEEAAAEAEPAELSPSSAVHGVEGSLCAPAAHEGKVLPLKMRAPVLDEGGVSVEAGTSSRRAAAADVCGDAGDPGLVSESPGTSDPKSDREIALTFKDQEVAADVLKAGVDLAEEKPPVSDSPPDAQEIHVIEHERLGVQDSGHKASNLSFNELYPSGTLKLQDNFDTIEQQFGDLPDNKDSAECDIAKVDGKRFGAQSNFTLILEGEEGEIEAGDSIASNVFAKAANTAAEEKHGCGGEIGHHGHAADSPSVTARDRESQQVEALPRVPEPIQVAIAENLFDVIRDTRSKEITSGTMDPPSIHKNIPLINRKVICPGKVAQSTSKTIQETSTVTINSSQGRDMSSSRTRRRGQHVPNPIVRPAQQEESEAVAAPDTRGLSVRRRARRTEDLSRASESACSDIRGASQNQQRPADSGTPQRGQKRKEDAQNMLESDGPAALERLAPADGRLGMVTSSPLRVPAAEETQLSSVTKETPRRNKKAVENDNSEEMVHLDVKVSKAARSNGSTRKLKSAKVRASENTGQKQGGESKLSPVTIQTPRKAKKEVERAASVETAVHKDGSAREAAHSVRSSRKLKGADEGASGSAGFTPEPMCVDEAAPVQQDRRAKKGEVSTLPGAENSQLDTSQLALKTGSELPGKRCQMRKNPPGDVGPKAAKGVRSPKKAQTPSLQRRAAGSAPASSGKADSGRPAGPGSLLAPAETLATKRGVKRKLTNRTEHQSHTRAPGSVPEKHTTKDLKEPGAPEARGPAAATVTSSPACSSGTTRKLRSAKIGASENTGQKQGGESKLSPVTIQTPRKAKKEVERAASVETAVHKDGSAREAAHSVRSSRKLKGADEGASGSAGFTPEPMCVDEAAPVQQDRRAKKGEVSTLPGAENSQLDTSQLALKTGSELPGKRCQMRKNPPGDVGPKAAKGVRSPKKAQTPSLQRRAAGSAPASSGKADSGRPAGPGSLLAPAETLATKRAVGRKLTNRTEHQSHTRASGSVPEKHTTKDLKEPGAPKARGPAAASVTCSSRGKRTRASEAVSLPGLPGPQPESVFSPPVSKAPRKEKAEMIEALAQLRGLASDLSPKFVFSPPTLRTRQENASNTSRLGDKPKANTQSTETVGKQKAKTSRTTKTRLRSRNKKEDPWPPPPVKIRLISPLGSLAQEGKNKPQKVPAVLARSLGRSRKKRSSLPKQV